MSLTSNEIIMIVTPGLVTLMAGLSVYVFNRDLTRRRAARKAAADNRPSLSPGRIVTGRR